MFEVVVIGGGPGGSVAALSLARRGVRVRLVEQHRFPRDKVCGECVSALGVEVLRRIGVLRDVLRAGAVTLTHGVLHAPDGKGVRLRFPGEMLGVSRRVLDGVLLDAAARAGCEVLQPARCERLTPGRVPTLAVRDLSANQIHELTSRFVIVADGKSALPGGRPAATEDFGLKAHFEGVESGRDSVELFGVGGHYGGVAPVEGGVFNVAFAVPQERLRAGVHFDRLFELFQCENAALWRCFRRARRCGPWMASPLPRFGVRADWPAGVIPVGNAAAAIEPVGGEGMGLALWSGVRAAGMVADAVLAGTNPDVESLQKEYRRAWRARGAACRLAAMGVSKPWLCQAGVSLLKSSQLARQTLTRLLDSFARNQSHGPDHPISQEWTEHHRLA